APSPGLALMRHTPSPAARPLVWSPRTNSFGTMLCVGRLFHRRRVLPVQLARMLELIAMARPIHTNAGVAMAMAHITGFAERNKHADQKDNAAAGGSAAGTTVNGAADGGG